MAIYHASCKPLSRSVGRSSVAAAAYRSGSELCDERTGLTHDYTKKTGVVSAEIIAPHGLKLDRAALWSSAELAETRKDSRTAREWVIALPHELNSDQRRELAREFGELLSQKYGVAVDLAIHLPTDKDDGKNHHAHLLTTTRTIEKDGSLGDKSYAEWSATQLKDAGHSTSKDQLKELRIAWQDIANRGLERAGRPERIDARSHEDRGLLEKPTTHLGHAATAMERNGERSERGDQNRYRADFNNQLKQARAEVISLCAERDKRAAAADQIRTDKVAAQARAIKEMPTKQLIGTIKDKTESKAWCENKLKEYERIRFVPNQKDYEAHRAALIERDRSIEEAKFLEERAQLWRKQNPVKNFLGMTKPVDQMIERLGRWKAKIEKETPQVLKLEQVIKDAKLVEQKEVEQRKNTLKHNIEVLSNELVQLKTEKETRPDLPKINPQEQKLSRAERDAAAIKADRMRPDERDQGHGRG